ncbi:MAG: TRAP transporter small permease subunit [Stappiaceae bacterium]
MQTAFLHFAYRTDCLNKAFCLGLLSLVFLAQFTVVMLRYLFNIGFIQLQDTVSYSFAVLCILAVPTALRSDAHVRVDIFRAEQSPATARRFDVAAVIFFLIPVFGLTLWHAYPLVAYSWSIFEGSRETGGLPGFFLVLTALPITCALALIQGLAILLDSKILSEKEAAS